MVAAIAPPAESPYIDPLWVNVVVGDLARQSGNERGLAAVTLLVRP